MPSKNAKMIKKYLFLNENTKIMHIKTKLTLGIKSAEASAQANKNEKRLITKNNINKNSYKIYNKKT